jgi:hypothetical protein
VKAVVSASSDAGSADVQELKTMVAQLLKTIAETRSPPPRKPRKFLPNRNEKGEPHCFNCNEYGHVSRSCPQPKKSREASNAGGGTGAASKNETLQISVTEIGQISTYEVMADGSQRFRFQFNSIAADHYLQLKEMASQKILETVELCELSSGRRKSTDCLVDTGSDLTIVSPEWCQEIEATVIPWKGPQL